MKKKLTKVEKWIVKEVMRQNERFKEIFSWFYTNGTINDYEFPAVEDWVFNYLYDKRELYTDEDDEKNRERIENNILQIHQNVLEGKTGYIEVRFDKGMIYSGGKKYELCNTIAVIRECRNFLDVFFKEGDRYDAKIFIEEGTENAYLVVKWDGSEEVGIIWLDGFYLLSTWREERSVQDTGIMIGYEWTEKDKNLRLLMRLFLVQLGSCLLQTGFMKNE